MPAVRSTTAPVARAVQPPHGHWIVDRGDGSYDIRQFANEQEAREYADALNRETTEHPATAS